MHLFYTPDIQANQSHYQLAEEESKHAIRVLRLAQGQSVILIDGIGGWFEAVIQDTHPKRTQLEILSYSPEYQKIKYHMHIAIAPTKNIDRLEWFLEKATEIGIQEITPLISEHSERKEVKVDRLNKVVISAMKQSLKAYKPHINPAIPFDKFISLFANTPEIGKAIAHCEPGDDKVYLNEVFESAQNYLVLIGPEGDFSPPEIQAAKEAGFNPISLGEARLRTETAALYACAELALLNR